MDILCRVAGGGIMYVFRRGAQSLGRGGLFHYAGRPTFTYYIRLFALNLVDACSFSCWCWKKMVFSSSSSFSSSSVSRVVSIPLLSLPIIFWVCVGRMQMIIFGWKGGRPNVEMRIPHILCWWHFFFFFFFVGGIAQLEVKAPSISWLVLLS